MDLAQIYETFFPKIYNYIFYRVLHKEAAEDLVSTVFLKVAENFGSYDPGRGAVSTWIYTIAENVLNDHFRRAHAVPVSFEELGDSRKLSVDFEEQSNLIKDEQRRELYRALAELDRQSREIVAKRYFLEKTIREIAKEQEINENTAYTLHRRAIEKLRKTIGISMG